MVGMVGNGASELDKPPADGSKKYKILGLVAVVMLCTIGSSKASAADAALMAQRKLVASGERALDGS